MLQTIEAALGMCCGGRQALRAEFQEAGAGPAAQDALKHSAPLAFSDICTVLSQACLCCAAHLNMTVARIFGFPVEQGFPLQVCVTSTTLSDILTWS